MCLSFGLIQFKGKIVFTFPNPDPLPHDDRSEKIILINEIMLYTSAPLLMTCTPHALSYAASPIGGENDRT